MSTSRKGDFLFVTCHFARGITTKGCTIQLKNGKKILLQRMLPVSEECEAIHSTPCHANGSIDLSALPSTSGKISLLVSDWELNSFENSIKLTIQSANNNSTGVSLPPANNVMITLIIAGKLTLLARI